MKTGDKIMRLSDGKIFTYDGRCGIGFGNIYVKELNNYVYGCDFEKINYKTISRKLKTMKYLTIC